MKTKEDIIAVLRQKEAELAEELRKMREFHKAAWEQYGSELCAGEMTEKERKLEAQLLSVRDFINKVDKEENP